MQPSHVKRPVLDGGRLPFSPTANPAHAVESATAAHPGEGSGSEQASWEAAWIDLGGEG